MKGTFVGKTTYYYMTNTFQIMGGELVWRIKTGTIGRNNENFKYFLTMAILPSSTSQMSVTLNWPNRDYTNLIASLLLKSNIRLSCSFNFFRISKKKSFQILIRKWYKIVNMQDWRHKFIQHSKLPTLNISRSSFLFWNA